MGKALDFLLPWDSQPQETAGVNPGYSQATSFALLYSGAVGDVNLVNGQLSSVSGTGQTFASSLFGNVASFNGSGTARPTFRASTKGQATFVFLGDVLGATMSDRLISCYNGPSDTGQYELYQAAGGLSLQTFRATVHDEWYFSNSDGGLTTFTGCLVVCVSGTSDPRAWLGGERLNVTRSATGGGAINGPGTIVSVGGRPDITTRQVNANFALAALIAADVGNVEGRRLAQEPWSLFEPQRIFIPEAAAGGVPTLSLPTYVPNSRTSVGFRPRVTAT